MRRKTFLDRKSRSSYICLMSEGCKCINDSMRQANALVTVTLMNLRDEIATLDLGVF